MIGRILVVSLSALCLASCALLSTVPPETRSSDRKVAVTEYVPQLDGLIYEINSGGLPPITREGTSCVLDYRLVRSQPEEPAVLVTVIKTQSVTARYFYREGEGPYNYRRSGDVSGQIEFTWDNKAPAGTGPQFSGSGSVQVYLANEEDIKGDVVPLDARTEKHLYMTVSNVLELAARFE